MAGRPKSRARKLVAQGVTAPAGDERACDVSTGAPAREPIPDWELIDALTDEHCRRVVLETLSEVPSLQTIDRLTRIETYRARALARQLAEIELKTARNAGTTDNRRIIVDLGVLIGRPDYPAGDSDPTQNPV